MSRGRLIGGVLVVCLACLAASPAAAQEGDGAYHRLDSDFFLSLGVGGGGIVDGAADGALLGDLRFRYLDMVGLVVAPEWHVDAYARLTVAVEVRPLFLLRFFFNRQTGNAWVDLLIDSIGAEVGAAITPLTEDVGAGLSLGFGFSLPILLPSVFADGLFLRLGARHVRAGTADQAGPPGGVSDWLFWGALTVKIGVRSGLAGREMPRWRP